MAIDPKKNQPISWGDALAKLRRWCAYQDRCSADVIKKMRGWGFDAIRAQEALALMTEEKMVDDARFAASLVRGKHRTRGWGAEKIRNSLRGRRVPEEMIDTAISALDPAAYRQKLMALLLKKRETLSAFPPHEVKARLARYAQSKGYAPELIWGVIGEMEV